ncbi:hypothetical protein TCE0_022f06860 [Talaromyces pinophilus]|uniref:Uncharacterized protein n=1 Tax=Talaromyces pinophilus TaxID=128442 RepID=A0A6V8H7Q2_TALPI|nr:hypothetical protein TCE0_022f06860 [Talaromyces pinophilus]
MSRAASARKSKGGYGQHNLRQYPIQVLDGESDLTPRSRLVCAKDTIPTSLSGTGYERMRIQYNFDLLDLSALTTFHVAHATASALAAHPTRLTDILRCRQWSYLTYLPSRIGHCDSLDRAAECVAARVQNWLAFPSEPISKDVLRLYSKALEALRTELENPDSFLRADVLCATEMLGIYELLKMSTEQAWIQHSSGATTLTRLRGARRYKTEFEKALLLSHIGQIFHESLNMNEPCFLEHETWQTILRSMATKDHPFSDRSDLVISLWSCICSLPKYLRRVTDIVCTSPNTSNLAICQLKLDLFRLYQSISQWHQEYQVHSWDNELHPSRSPADADKQFEALGFCFTCLIVTNRLIFALDPSAGATYEYEAQKLAADLVTIEQNALSVNGRAELFMALKMHVAKATRATAETWRECTTNTIGSTIPQSVFTEWCQLTGWKTY